MKQEILSLESRHSSQDGRTQLCVLIVARTSCRRLLSIEKKAVNSCTSILQHNWAQYQVIRGGTNRNLEFSSIEYAIWYTCLLTGLLSPSFGLIAQHDVLLRLCNTNLYFSRHNFTVFFFSFTAQKRRRRRTTTKSIRPDLIDETNMKLPFRRKSHCHCH